MGTKQDGQKNQVRGACKGRNCNATGECDNSVGQASREYADEQIGANRPDWPGENFSVNSRETTIKCGETTTGKILSQLRELREAHLAYVKAHEQRLEARLRESREHQDKVVDEMDRLEQEIIDLLSNSETE